MDSSPKISVIIPAYKVEPYFRQCLDSVVDQTYRNLEIIIVDDGSPDRCGEIADEYAQKDDRIIVIHKENGGLSAGWNDGMSVSTGDWIAFVDSDDWVERSYFEELLKGVSGAEDAEIIIGKRFYENNNDASIERSCFSEPFLFKNAEGKTFLLTGLLAPKNYRKEHIQVQYAWNKLYRAAFIKDNGLTFDTTVRAGLGNDNMFNFAAYDKAKTVCGVDCIGYHYRILDTGGTRKYTPERSKEAHDFLEHYYRYIDQNQVTRSMKDAFDAYALVYVAGNLSFCYFSPDNKENYRTVARKVRQMKKMPRYRDAIFSNDNRYLTTRLKILKYALRLPVIWPVKLLCTAKQKTDK